MKCECQVAPARGGCDALQHSFTPLRAVVDYRVSSKKTGLCLAPPEHPQAGDPILFQFDCDSNASIWHFDAEHHMVGGSAASRKEGKDDKAQAHPTPNSPHPKP